MRSKLFLLVPVLVLALVLSACSGATVSATQPVNRNLSVNGLGTVYIVPDVAYIYIGVHTENMDISQAVSDNNIQALAVATALKEFGVAETDIQTTNFSIYPQTVYDEFYNQAGSTYAVDNTVYVTVRDLSKIGELLETAINAGANSINSITFDVEDKTAAMTEARQKAVENASGLAAELAAAAGVELGDIQTISFYDSQPYAYYGIGGGGGADATTPISLGQLTLNVTVSITYGLK